MMNQTSEHKFPITFRHQMLLHLVFLYASSCYRTTIYYVAKHYLLCHGDLTSRQNGSVGGYMVKKMIEQQEKQIAGK